MAQVDTRHSEKDLLMALLMAQSHPETIPMQIAKAKAKMEREDISEVMQEYESWLKHMEEV
ncbi:MAG: hypothetical protein FWG45_01855 [Oscillospiraceae bacterium]|nr:hypothetical protein [Oscillospiraceae bacterium]